MSYHKKLNKVFTSFIRDQLTGSYSENEINKLISSNDKFIEGVVRGVVMEFSKQELKQHINDPDYGVIAAWLDGLNTECLEEVIELPCWCHLYLRPKNSSRF